MEGNTRVLDGQEWSWIAAVAGILALSCYFFSVVFNIFPWAVGRIMFYAFGPSLTLAAFAVGFLLREDGRWRPLFSVGVLFTCIAGVAVNMMAVIQDSNFTMMAESIREAELESTREMLKEILWGINWVQLSLDIVFDIWIAGGAFFLALGALVYRRELVIGISGIVIGTMALGLNFATLPHPPAESGLFDPGPFVATWMGVFLGMTIFRSRTAQKR